MTDFVIADLHLGDDRLCGNGKARPRPFESALEMACEIVARWNELVHPDDSVYVLGDIGRGSAIERIRELKGRKYLIAGNCDAIRSIVGRDLFADIFVARRLGRALLTHIPVHPSQLEINTVNIHGHLHGDAIDDPRYICVSVNRTGFRPVPITILQKQIDFPQIAKT